jgi:glucose/arabinose dehydrogenase
MLKWMAMLPSIRLGPRLRTPALNLTRLVAPIALTGLLLAACASGSGAGAGGQHSRTTTSTAGSGAPASRLHARPSSFAPATVRVAPGNGGRPFDVPRSLTVPSGWSVEVWARVPDARFAVWTPQHDLLVSASAAGQVVELTPGKTMTAASQKVLASGLSGPQGMAFDTFKDTRFLYVAETNQIDRYVWKGNGGLGPRTVVVSSLPDTDATGDDVHRAKSIVIGPDHTIYVTAGSASNATPTDRGESPPRGTILAYSRNGTHMRVFARGVRNGEGLSFAPDGSLWTAVNERDEVAYPFHRPYGEQGEAYGKVIEAYVNEHPADELARLTPGRNLGWPFCDPDPDVTPGDPSTALQYANLHLDADVQTNPGGSVLNCAALAPIERGLPAHSAPLGFHFLAGTKIASPWSSGAVVAVHGSWDRTPPRAPAVLWLPWQSKARTLGGAIPLISGFQEASGVRWGRPADAVAGPDGALYVTDDTAGAVYRVGPRHIR